MSKLSDKIGSFTTVPNSVIKLWPEVGIDGMALFLYLRYRTNSESDIAFPSYDTIQKDTTITRRRIAKAIRKLESCGLMERKRRFGASTYYTLKLPSISADAGLMRNSISTDAGLSLVQQGHTNKIESTKINKPLARKERAPRALTPFQEEQKKLETLFSELSGRPMPPGKAAVIWHITTAAWMKAANGQSESVMRAAYAAHTHDGLSVKGPQSIDYKFWELLNPAPKHESREL